MISEQIEQLVEELERVKIELSEALRTIEQYNQQQKVFIEQMAVIVIDYQSKDERDL